MKLQKDKKISAQQEPQEDLTTILFDLEDKYGIVFIENIEDEIFIYKPIGRKDWADVRSRELNRLEEEEIVCSICTLYPRDYDFANAVAGIPSQLYEKIIENSALSLEHMINIINYYRNEMETLNSKITCIINEAFPNFDIEEIENWGMDKTLKYFTRAEWKLAALRKIDIDQDIVDILNDAFAKNNEPIDESSEITNDTSEIVGASGMTPERLKELQKKFPEIDWANASTEL